jgi:hypothetical protein
MKEDVNMLARTPTCRAPASALIALASLGATGTKAEATSHYTVQLFVTHSGTSAFEQDAGPTELPHLSTGGFGSSTYTGFGFARPGSVGGDGAAAAVHEGGPGISNE